MRLRLPNQPNLRHHRAHKKSQDAAEDYLGHFVQSLMNPTKTECPAIPEAMTMAAVIGACCHIALTRTTRLEIKTVTPSAIGIIQCLWLPRTHEAEADDATNQYVD